MLPEYNLEGKKGVRGKYAKAMQKGYSVRVLNEDGTVTVRDFAPKENDESNREKNWEKHGVLASECEEVFFNLPLLLQPDTAHSQKEPRYYVLGHTVAGRRLFIVFTIRADPIRVISVRDMSKKERSVYEQITS